MAIDQVGSSYNDQQDRVTEITILFDTVSRDITGITVRRDPGGLFAKIFIGVGPNGNPINTDKSINVPEGTTALTAQQLRQLGNRGVDTIEDYEALSITVGQ